MAQWKKSFSEQRILIVDANYITCKKIQPIHIAEPGLTAGRWQAGGRQVADKMQVNLEILKITVHRKIRLLLHLTMVQHHYSSKNA